MSEPLHVVLVCSEALLPKVRYVFDTLFMAGGIPLAYTSGPPATGPWIYYGSRKETGWPVDRCLAIAHCPDAWRLFYVGDDVDAAVVTDGIATVFPQISGGYERRSDIIFDIPFDIAANAFYFLSSWAERVEETKGQTRRLYSNSVFARLGVPQTVVDQYLGRVIALLSALCGRLGFPGWALMPWPQGATYALVLSHDIDYISSGILDTAKQGVKTVLRHLVRQRDPADALRAAARLAQALARRRDPYCCIPEIIERERALGIRASFQVAVGHRHPHDVNYRIEDDRIRDYLRAIPESGFELCLHGSYRSTENSEWYIEEAALLTERLGRPLGSRQHFLSFDYDALFAAQERAGIQYDMSMGYPDRTGPRAGFSYPYFPYCLAEDRPYDVVEISLFVMDVTLRSYMGLKGGRAWGVIEGLLKDLRKKGGCVSVVWHPIVFGGARDPGYDRLFWDTVDYVRGTGGLATDGRAINGFWRERARAYQSFASRGLQ